MLTSCIRAFAHSCIHSSSDIHSSSTSSSSNAVIISWFKWSHTPIISRVRLS